MECTIRDFDQMMIRGLKSGDAHVQNRCVRRVFYEDLEGLIRTIQSSLYKGTVEYDELVGELYLFLAKDNWKILDSFTGRNGAKLSTWLSHVAWHYFMNAHKNANRTTYCYDMSVQFGKRVAVTTSDEMRIDVYNTLSKMPNQRYVAVIRLMIIEGRDSDEVAKMMGTTVQNIYNLKHRAISQFLEYYNR